MMAELVTRNSLEQAYAARLEKLFGESKRRAIAFILAGKEPDSAFWAELKRRNDEELAALMALMFLESGEQHAADIGARIGRNQIEQNAVSYTRNRLRDISGDIITHTQERFGNAINRISSRTEGSVTERELDAELDSAFGSQRANSIAFTEANRAMVAGGENIISVSGLLVKRYWAHSSIRPPRHSRAAVLPCPICSPLEGRPESEWGGLMPGDAHPNCDCYVEYRDAKSGNIIGRG